MRNDEQREYRLALIETDEPGVFRLAEGFRYRDLHHDEPFVVPGDLSRFTTDLKTLPRPLSILDPGTHYARPAVLLHGLITGNFSGPQVSPGEAHRIYRDALRELGMGGVRRWTACTLLDWVAVLRGRLGHLRAVSACVAAIGAFLVSGLLLLAIVSAAAAEGMESEQPALDAFGILGAPLVVFVVALIISPVVTWPIFGRQWRSGAVGIASLAALGPPVAFGIWLYFLYVKVPIWIFRGARAVYRLARPPISRRG